MMCIILQIARLRIYDLQSTHIFGICRVGLRSLDLSQGSWTPCLGRSDEEPLQFMESNIEDSHYHMISFICCFYQQINTRQVLSGPKGSEVADGVRERKKTLRFYVARRGRGIGSIHVFRDAC